MLILLGSAPATKTHFRTLMEFFLLKLHDCFIGADAIYCFVSTMQGISFSLMHHVLLGSQSSFNSVPWSWKKMLVRHSAIAHAHVEEKKKKRQTRLEFHNTQTQRWSQTHHVVYLNGKCIWSQISLLLLLQTRRARRHGGLRDVCNLRFGITWPSERPQSRQTTECPLYGAKQIHWGRAQ